MNYFEARDTFACMTGLPREQAERVVAEALVSPNGMAEHPADAGHPYHISFDRERHTFDIS